MYYVVAFFVGLIVGAICLFLYLAQWHARARERERASESRAKVAQAAADAARARAQDVEQLATRLRAGQAELDGRVIAYSELQHENAILKRDLQNMDVYANKLELDGEVRQQRQEEIETRSAQLAKRYLGETVKAVVSAIGPSNFSACKQRLVDAIERCRGIGFAVPEAEETALLTDLRKEFEKAVRAAFEREEQARIKAQIREEERLKREIERELKQLERERAAIQAALDQALAEAQGQHSLEVERLKARLTEAEEKSRRAISMAQQTKSGHVYVISNIGTFGQDVFKVGMTRRLDPKERIFELGSASVPFPFDIHMMIRCNDAPALENALHRALHKRRVNKANPRKEFFRASIGEICEIVRAHHGEVEYVADPEALEYRQSMSMTDDDAAFIESVYSTVDDNDANAVADDV